MQPSVPPPPPPCAPEPPRASLFVGCAGWSIPPAETAHFPGDGSHLERYSRRLPATEINSTFHRSHRATTYERWRDATPPSFRFSVKLPKTITHELRLEGADKLLKEFVAETGLLRDRLGPCLVQLPPKLEFDRRVCRRFFALAKKLYPHRLVCEPRHASWFSEEADTLLQDLEVARVAADPSKAAPELSPGGWRGLSYFRLHGSPRMYYSSYSSEFLGRIASQLQDDLLQGREVWCIFDNTTLGAAAGNALEIYRALQPPG